jgi:AcrR family transcriptional regulator/DNA-binding MarR family transcriptional regulator
MLAVRAESRHNGSGNRAATARAGSLWFSEAQRARILGAAYEIMAEHGFASTTVAPIVARARVSRKTFYTMFGSFEDCYVAVLDDALARIGRVAAGAYAGPGSWCQRLRAALAATLAFLDDEPMLTSVLFLDAPAVVAPAALARRREVLKRLEAAVEEGRSEARPERAVPSLTAEGLVGGAIAVVQARVRERPRGHLLDLTSPLTAMLVLAYLGPAAAAREQRRAPPQAAPPPAPVHPRHPPMQLGRVGMRLTYRTLRVLQAIAAHPGARNRDIAAAADVSDPGQISRLLSRLQGLGLVQNTGSGAGRGGANSWRLTSAGEALEATMERLLYGGRERPDPRVSRQLDAPGRNAPVQG